MASGVLMCTHTFVNLMGNNQQIFVTIWKWQHLTSFPLLRIQIYTFVTIYQTILAISLIFIYRGVILARILLSFLLQTNFSKPRLANRFKIPTIQKLIVLR